MITDSLEVHQPKDWKDAWQILGRTGVRTLPVMVGPHPIALSDWDADAVVDLSQLGLRYIKRSTDGEVQIGALTTLQDLVDSVEVKSLDGGLLSTAAFQVAPSGMLNLASIGGALYEKGGPPEVILALMVLDAVVVVETAWGVRRELSTASFLESSTQEVHSRGVIVEVRLPARTGENTGWGLERVARTPRDAAIVAAAAVLEADGDRVRFARLALAGASRSPRRFPGVEEQLENQAFTEDLLQKVAGTLVIPADPAAGPAAEPVADDRGSAGYRQAMARVLGRRALRMAWMRATGG